MNFLNDLETFIGCNNTIDSQQNILIIYLLVNIIISRQLT